MSFHRLTEKKGFSDCKCIVFNLSQNSYKQKEIILGVNFNIEYGWWTGWLGWTSCNARQCVISDGQGFILKGGRWYVITILMYHEGED